MRGWLMQTKVEILRIFRNPYFVFWSLFMPIVFYFVFTNIFNTGMGDSWNSRFLMSVTCFSVMGTSILTLGIRLVEEKAHGWSNLMRTTPLSSSVYFSAKMVGQTMIHICSVAIIFVVGAVINGVDLSVWQWLTSALWILIGALPFLAIGTIIGAMNKVETAAGISNFFYMVLAFMGGLFMPIEVLPSIFKSIAKAIPSYHYGAGVWEITEGGTPSLLNIAVLAGYFLLFVVLSIYIRRKQEVVV
ncbi:ABC transporter permease [Cytobacillus kochii]